MTEGFATMKPVSNSVLQRGYGAIQYNVSKKMPTFDVLAKGLEADSASEGYSVVDILKVRCDSKNEFVTEVTERKLQTWSRDPERRHWVDAYHAWKAGTPAADGFPIKEWPAISKAEAQIFDHCGVYTLEQFCQMGDDEIGQLRMPRGKELHQAAKKFLDNTVHTASAMREAGKVVELEQQNAALANQLAELQGLVSKLVTEEEKPKAKTKAKRKKATKARKKAAVAEEAPIAEFDPDLF